MSACARSLEEANAIAVGVGLFYGDDGVAPLGHRRAGHHLDGAPLGEGIERDSTGTANAEGPFFGGHLPDLGGANRPTVHRGRVERRNVLVRGDVLGEDAGDRLVERNLLARQGRNRVEEAREGVVEVEHGLRS